MGGTESLVIASLRQFFFPNRFHTIYALYDAHPTRTHIALSKYFPRFITVQAVSTIFVMRVKYNKCKTFRNTYFVYAL